MLESLLHPLCLLIRERRILRIWIPATSIGTLRHDLVIALDFELAWIMLYYRVLQRWQLVLPCMLLVHHHHAPLMLHGHTPELLIVHAESRH